MAQFTISLPDAAKIYIDQQIATGQYATAGEVLLALIEQEQQRQAEDTLNAMLQSSLEKGNPVAATDEWWEAKREQLH
jgi:antitoxin ParD1/3/4